ncbi:dsRNA-binding motif domain-containing protein [Lapidilactobacillus bayanensis]|uniref:hypothetical protein n=1 Tax=Lapidilactobacillus bayanensis TaxID=2485998 RepID=UPI000F767A15|nr:hypothetical protein [Lapidilactobacillus bayanensis]
MEDLKEEVKDHGDRLNRVEKDVQNLREDLRSGLQRVDSSNQYLREQNNQILKEILKRNNSAEQHDFEIQKITKGNQLKMFGMIFGASGLAAVVIDVIVKLFK